MSETNRGGGRSADAFAEALADLKERGSMLLLTGSNPDVVGTTCDRLLGERGPEPRQRLFVLTDRSPTHTRSVEATRTITYGLAVRSAAASSMATGGPGRVVEGDLDDLGAAVAEAVADVERESGGLDPAELRICLDSAGGLLATHDRESLFGFLDRLSEAARESRGMCHVHLPADFEAEGTRLLASRFDAVIETRDDGRERWHLREPDLTTDWLAPG